MRSQQGVHAALCSFRLRTYGRAVQAAPDRRQALRESRETLLLVSFVCRYKRNEQHDSLRHTGGWLASHTCSATLWVSNPNMFYKVLRKDRSVA